MSAQLQHERVVRPHRALLIVGILLLCLGFAWFAWGGITSVWSADHGNQPEGSIQQEIAQVGVLDPQENPDMWVGMDEQGNVVWQGTEAELDALLASGRADLQDDLRVRYLYPSLLVMAAGGALTIVAVVRARRA